MILRKSYLIYYNKKDKNFNNNRKIKLNKQEYNRMKIQIMEMI